MTAQPLTAVVLAGSRTDPDQLALAAGVRDKAMIDVGGKPMLWHVLHALAGSPHIARIVVVSERRELPDELGELGELGEFGVLGKPIEWSSAARGPSASVAQVLRSHGAPLIVTTADHPLLQSAWVDRMVSASPVEVDVVAALARRAHVEGALPGTKRTYLRFKDGEFSGCNLFFLRTPAALGVVECWSQLEAHRKRPLRLLGRLGVGWALRYRLGLLPLSSALRRLGQLAGARLAVVELADGRAAIDVDSAADLAAVRQLWRSCPR